MSRGISIHAPRTGSDDYSIGNSGGWEIFQSTLPARGATCTSAATPPRTPHFNPRSPHGERQVIAPKQPPRGYFNPRSPHGERQWLPTYKSEVTAFQSTLPARGATRYNHLLSRHGWRFQSTLPARGATSLAIIASQVASNFNPRSPHGERLSQKRNCPRLQNFNPRSPHGERHPSHALNPSPKQFQSTLPARGATAFSDSAATLMPYFNPRSPHGERQPRKPSKPAP